MLYSEEFSLWIWQNIKLSLGHKFPRPRSWPTEHNSHYSLMTMFWILWGHVWPILHVTEKSLVQVFPQWCSQEFKCSVLAWQEHWYFGGAVILERSLYTRCELAKVLKGVPVKSKGLWELSSCFFYATASISLFTSPQILREGISGKERIEKSWELVRELETTQGQ